MARISLQTRMVVWSLMAALAFPAGGEARRRHHHGHHINAVVDARPAMRRNVGWLPAIAGVARMCSGQAHELADWPIERIAQTIGPTPPQRSALDELRRTANEAVEALRADCPSDAVRTPTERVEVVRRALDAMLRAVNIVRPALENFYGTLDDEQKAQVNAMAGQESEDASTTRPRFGQLCEELSAADFGEWRLERVEEAIRPSRAQLE